MIPINLTGCWKGFFSYGPEYGEELFNQKVNFMLHLKANGKEFEGTSVDIEGVGANFETATIKGFVEGDLISFVKQYPFDHFFNEDGSVQTDTSKPQPEIHYTGHYHERKKIFIGDWEMVIHSEPYGKGWIEESCTGQWEMGKED
jgi:hypothetical protein